MEIILRITTILSTHCQLNVSWALSCLVEFIIIAILSSLEAFSTDSDREVEKELISLTKSLIDKTVVGVAIGARVSRNK
jgi:hypothetical protein